MNDTHGSVVIFGRQSEVDIADEIYKNVNPELRSASGGPNFMINIAGKTSLRELISLISECDVFVTNDSDPVHIACAVGTPLVAIFASTDPELTVPPPQAEG